VLGASHSSIVGYVLGYPFLNESILNETYMVPRVFYDYDDRNISDFMQYMFTCFAKYGSDLYIISISIVIIIIIIIIQFIEKY